MTSPLCFASFRGPSRFARAWMDTAQPTLENFIIEISSWFGTIYYLKIIKKLLFFSDVS